MIVKSMMMGRALTVGLAALNTLGVMANDIQRNNPTPDVSLPVPVKNTGGIMPGETVTETHDVKRDDTAFVNNPAVQNMNDKQKKTNDIKSDNTTSVNNPALHNMDDKQKNQHGPQKDFSGDCRERREIRDLSSQELQKFVNAIKELHKRKSPTFGHKGYSIWDELVMYHTDAFEELHKENLFFPW
jgi:hypothetical protein